MSPPRMDARLARYFQGALLRLLSQAARSLISDLPAGATTCRRAPYRPLCEHENAGKFVTYHVELTNRRLIFITLNFRPTNGRRRLRALVLSAVSLSLMVSFAVVGQLERFKSRCVNVLRGFVVPANTADDPATSGLRMNFVLLSFTSVTFFYFRENIISARMRIKNRDLRKI